MSDKTQKQTKQSNLKTTENQKQIWVTATTDIGTRVRLPADNQEEALAYIKTFREWGYKKIGVCEPANKQGYPQIWTVSEAKR